MAISRSEQFQMLFGIPDDIMESLIPAEAMAELWSAVDKTNQPVDAPKIVIGRNPYAGNPDDDIIAPWLDDDIDDVPPMPKDNEDLPF